jgi:hypothetical protein
VELSFSFGFSGGGTDLVIVTLTDGSTQTLSAGTGVSILLGLGCTLGRSGPHALSVELQGGVKGWNIGGDETDFYLSLVRLPLMLRLQYGYEVDPGIYLFLASGPYYETRIKLSSSGALAGLDTTFDDSLGWLGEVGMLLDAGMGGFTLSLRYTGLTYTGVDLIGSVEGQSIGLFFGANLALASEVRPPDPPARPVQAPVEAPVSEEAPQI